MLLGIVFVGWGGIWATSGGEIPISIPALIIIFGAQVLNGATLVIEEKIFMTYNVNPMYLLGLEGIYSMILQIGILSALQFIKCTETLTMCINGKVEDTLFAFK